MISKRITFSITSLMCAVLFGFIVMRMQAQGDQPVEQTRKNIQVLKGLPESQLFPLMNFVATSLGVKCDYCHVRKGEAYYNGNWVWESDEKPKKLVGRRMIKMVLDINRTNFDGANFVTCYTCHRGNTVIARLPPLPPHDPPARTETALPTADQILAKYVAAVGGNVLQHAFEVVEHAQPAHAHVAATDEDRERQQQTEQNHEDELGLAQVEEAHRTASVHRCGVLGR